MSHTAAIRVTENPHVTDRTESARINHSGSTLKFEPVLNSEEAAALLQIHPKTLQKMARQGRVPAFRLGDLWRFRASDLDEWLKSGLSSKSPLVP